MNTQILLEALGGAANIKEVLVRSSRLLLEVASVDRFDEAALQSLGVRAVVRIAPTLAHLLLGPTAETVGRDMTRLIGEALLQRGLRNCSQSAETRK